MPGSYGDKKLKDMAESLLPSTGRKHARYSKAQVKRSHRRGIRRSLAQLRYNDFEDIEDSVDHDSDVSDVVWERRNKDNVSAVQRWAEAITKDIERGERVDFMRRLLPDNLIGRHAITHIDYIDKDHNWGAYKAENRHKSARRRESDIAALTAICYQVLSGPHHRDFNNYIRPAFHPVHWSSRRLVETYFETHPNGYWKNLLRYRYEYDYKGCCSSVRLLLGFHDTQAFVAHCLSHPTLKDKVLAWSPRS